MEYMTEYQRWCERADQDVDLVEELKEMSTDKKKIEDAFYCNLAFGTGGLRGVIGAGTNRMNIYTVAKASQVFIDSGLGNALIQKKNADDIDFSTVFYFNFVVCCLLYVVMFFMAPVISSFYNDKTLVNIMLASSILGQIINSWPNKRLLNYGYLEQLKDILPGIFLAIGIHGPESVEYVGGNAKMNEFQAAMGLCNLRHLAEEIGKRKKVVEKYRKRLGGVEGIKLSELQEGVESNYAYFPVVFDGYKYTRNEVFERLAEQGIGARKYFYPLTNSFECYRNYPTAGTEKTPVAQHMALRVLTLPLYADLSLEDVDRICDVILS